MQLPKKFQAVERNFDLQILALTDKDKLNAECAMIILIDKNT